MSALPDASSDLFAAKGRALPSCAEPLTERPGHDPADAKHQGGAPGPGRDKRHDDEPASVLSIDLRRALVSARPTGAPATEAAPALPVSNAIAAPPPPQNQGMAGPLIAAVVAISIAAGLFYVFGPHQRGAAPTTEATAATDPAREELVSPDNATRSPGTGQPPETANAAPPSSAAPAGQATEDKTAEDGKPPSFDIVRVEPNGATVIAGRAAPYAELILLHNGEPIGKVKADWAGEWAFIADQPLPADQHRITILVNDPDAEITLPAGVEPPAQITGTLNSGPR